MERTTRTRLVSLGVLLVVLASGFVLGLAWDRRGAVLHADDAATEREAEAADTRREGDDERDRKERRRLIIDRVGLTDQQQARVDSIVRSHRERMKELQREFRAEYNPRYWALIDDTRDGIRTLLTPDQRATYDSLLAEHDRKRRDRDRDGPERRDGRESEGGDDGDDGKPRSHDFDGARTRAPAPIPRVGVAPGPADF